MFTFGRRLVDTYSNPMMDGAIEIKPEITSECLQLHSCHCLTDKHRNTLLKIASVPKDISAMDPTVQCVRLARHAAEHLIPDPPQSGHRNM